MQNCKVYLTKSKTHFKSAEGTPDVQSLILKVQMDHSSKQISCCLAELKCLAFLVEHNFPLRLMDHFPNFLRNICFDSSEKLCKFCANEMRQPIK